jgi:dTDP-4-amino-4,6-dideoxygalactose transaminase
MSARDTACRLATGSTHFVSPNTYVATWLAVTAVGAVPVAVEPDDDTCNLDPGALDAAVTDRTAAILPVHLYGQPADMTRVQQVARRHGLAVLEDAAQAHGAAWQGKRVGSLGTSAAWSFYPTKNLGALGDAGAVTTDDDQIAGRLRQLRNYGTRVKYESDVRGWNSRMDEMQAAVLSTKLPLLDSWNARRRQAAAGYEQLLSPADLKLPCVGDGADPVWHIYAVRHRQRDNLREHLRSRGIETLIHYPVPPYRQGAYREGGYLDGSFPISDAIHKEVLSLPIAPHTSEDEIVRVSDAILEFRSEIPLR